MKRALCYAITFILIVLLIAGCGIGSRNAVAGTWYGDNQDMLILNVNGGYTSTWLGDGKYRVDGDMVLLSGSGMAEGSLKELKVGKVDGKNVLQEEVLAVTYYTASSDADAAIERQKELVREQEEQRAVEELDALKKDLIGTWEWAGYAGEVIFGADGTISGTVSGMKPGTYEVIDLSNIKITNEEQTYTKRIQYSEEENTQKLIFGTLNLVKK